MVAQLVQLILFNRYNRRFERFFRSFLSRSSDQDQAVAPALHRPTTALKGDSVLFRAVVVRWLGGWYGYLLMTGTTARWPGCTAW